MNDELKNFHFHRAASETVLFEAVVDINKVARLVCFYASLVMNANNVKKALVTEKINFIIVREVKINC